jgi:hypothetical protein
MKETNDEDGNPNNRRPVGHSHDVTLLFPQRLLWRGVELQTW